MKKQKLKDKPRFRASKEIERSFKINFAKFIGQTVEVVLKSVKNVQSQSSSGTTRVD